MFRIQKTILAEYPEMYEPVLVEGPFAQVSEHGIGIRQVHIGLTPTKIIIGQDVFNNKPPNYWSDKTIPVHDPEIESFELMSALPLEALRFFFFRKRNRMLMEVRIIKSKMMIFEFGGYLLQNLFWNTWRERIVTLRQIGGNLFNICASSPFSSSDIIDKDKQVHATIHSSQDKESNDSGDVNFSIVVPKPSRTLFYSKFNNISESLSDSSIRTISHQHLELENYIRSVSATNTHSCHMSW